MRVNAYASLRHYADHLLPIWEALPPEGRGVFYGTGSPECWWGPAAPPRVPAGEVMMVASAGDATRWATHRVVYVEHGSGQSYGGDRRSGTSPSYSGGGGLDHVVLFLCPNDAVARRWQERYDTPTATVGCPRLDRWHDVSPAGRQSSGRNGANAPLPVGPHTVPPWPLVAVTFHWDCTLVPETRSAWSHYDTGLPDLVAGCRRVGGEVLGHGHPRAWRYLRRRWRMLGVEPVEHFDDVVERADLLIADNTSAMWEWAALDRPLVVLDAPWYRRHVEHGLRFWEHADAGVRIAEPSSLMDAVLRAAADPAEQATRRRAAADAVYAHRDGQAARRAAAEIMGLE